MVELTDKRVTIILTLVLLYVGLTNTVRIFINAEPLNRLWGFSAIFFISAIVNCFCINRLSNKWLKQLNVMMILAYGCMQAMIGYSGNFSGSILFVYAIHLDYSRNKAISKCVLLFVCVIIKSYITDMIPAQALTLLFMNFVVIGLYFVIFRTPEKKENDNEEVSERALDLSDKDDQVIKYILNNMEPKQIDYEILAQPGTVRKRIRRMRKKNKCNTDLLLGIKIGQDNNKIDKLTDL